MHEYRSPLAFSQAGCAARPDAGGREPGAAGVVCAALAAPSTSAEPPARSDLLEALRGRRLGVETRQVKNASSSPLAQLLRVNDYVAR